MSLQMCSPRRSSVESLSWHLLLIITWLSRPNVWNWIRLLNMHFLYLMHFLLSHPLNKGLRHQADEAPSIKIIRERCRPKQTTRVLMISWHLQSDSTFFTIGWIKRTWRHIPVLLLRAPLHLWFPLQFSHQQAPSLLVKTVFIYHGRSLTDGPFLHI